MSSKVPGSNLFGALLVVLLIGGMVYAAKQVGTSAPAQGGATDTLVPEGITPAPVAEIDEPATQETPVVSTPQPTLLFVRSASNGQQLIRRVAAGSESVIFTDADTAVKLQAVLGVLDEKAIAMFTADDGHTELRSIALDGSGRTETLNASFGGAAGAAFSSTTKQVAYAVFDNAERSFGFSLVREALDGTSRSVVDSDPNGIALPVWSADGKRVAYIQGQATPDAGQILKIATIGGASDAVYTFEQNTAITSLAWLDDQSLAYSAEPLGNNTQNAAQTYALDLASKQARSLVDGTGKDRSLLVSRDGAWLAFVAGNVTAGDTQPAGLLTVIELATGKQQTLSAASATSAWMVE